VLQLQEYNNKYEHEHEVEPVKIDEKYLKIMEEMYQMQDDLDELFGEITTDKFTE